MLIKKNSIYRILIPLMIFCNYLLAYMLVSEISILGLAMFLYIIPFSFLALVNWFTKGIEKNIGTICFFSVVNTLGYTIFAFLFERKDDFEEIVNGYTKGIGDMQVTVTVNFLAMGQIILLFLSSFAIQYVVRMICIKVRGGKNDRN